VETTGETFQIAVFAHLLVAAILTLHVVLWTTCIARSHRRQRALIMPVVGLMLLILLQLALGAGTWVVKYSWPEWLEGLAWTEAYTIRAQGMLQALTVTAHTATGSLILAVTVALAMRGCRLVGRQAYRTTPTATVEHAAT